MKGLSIIIPFCNEWPQIVFTLRALRELAIGGIHDPVEVIVVDNYVESEVDVPADRGHERLNDKGEPCGSHLKAMAKRHDWLRYVRYDHKLSHWNAKNAGVAASKYDYLLFLDAHVFPAQFSLPTLYGLYKEREEEINGSLHFILTYHILEKQRLIYKPVIDAERGVYHYRFQNFNKVHIGALPVPCMSTCGMMISRKIYDDIGGWPSGLGIYGGGENFINYTMAILGYNKWVLPTSILHHHGDNRGYHWNYDDYHRNRMIALFMHSGLDMIQRYIEAGEVKIGQRKLRVMVEDIITDCTEQRAMLIDKQKFCLEEWAEQWKGDYL